MYPEQVFHTFLMRKKAHASLFNPSGWKHAEGELLILSDETRLIAKLIDGTWLLQVPNTILKRNEYSIWQVPANIHERALLREKEKRKSW